MSGGGQAPYKRTCCRCGNVRFAHALFPDGHICQSCLRAALRTRAACPACRRERPLIGRADGQEVCRECAGITRQFSCRVCGYEGEYCIARLCLRCRLDRQLTGLLNDGTGQVRAELRPLAGYMHDKTNPDLTLGWIKRPAVRDILSGLATGEIEISHVALCARRNWRLATYVLDLLVASGVLPAADRQLVIYEAWLRVRLEALAGHPSLRLLREFGTWHQLPRMRATAALRPLRSTAAKYAQLRFITAEVFLTWLDTRGQKPGSITQADIDAFYTSHKLHHRQNIRAFLTWAISQGHVPASYVPVIKFSKGESITQTERLDLIRRFAPAGDLPLHLRTAACLMLLYAQPLSRILRLTAGDIRREDDGRAYLRLGTPPAPVPEPFAAMLDELATAAGGAGWLFPGRHIGQPRGYRAVYRDLRDAGLPMRKARTSALRDLVVQAPAPVVADALGFHQTTTTRQLTAAGGTWNRYAASRAGRKRAQGMTPAPASSELSQEESQ